MPELITSQVTKEAFNLAGDLEERVTPIAGPVAINIPLDSPYHLRSNAFVANGLDNISTWDGGGDGYFINATNTGTFLGNAVYRHEKSTNNTFYRYKYNVSGLSSALGNDETVVFTAMVKASTSTSSNNPLSIFFGRGYPWTAGNYSSGTSLWTKSEYYGDGWWRISACALLPKLSVVSDYRERYFFAVTGSWASIGTYAYVACPYTYNGTSLYAYPVPFTPASNHSYEVDGLHIDKTATNIVPVIGYNSLPTYTGAGGSLSKLSEFREESQVFQFTGSTSGTTAVSFPADNTTEIAAAGTATVNFWWKKSSDADNNLAAIIGGSVWTGSAWGSAATPIANIGSAITFYDEMDNVITSPSVNQWVRTKVIFTNNNANKIKISECVLTRSTYPTLGAYKGVYKITTPMLQIGSVWSAYTPTSRTASTTGLVVPFGGLLAPFTISFKYRSKLPLASFVSQGTSPILLQMNTYAENPSLSLWNFAKDLRVYANYTSSWETSSTVTTFTDTTWNDKEHTYTLVFPDSKTVKAYMDSTYLGQVVTTTDLIFTSLKLAESQSGETSISIVRDLVVIARALNANEVGNVIASITKRYNTLQTKDNAVMTTSVPVSEGYNLLSELETFSGPTWNYTWTPEQIPLIPDKPGTARYIKTDWDSIDSWVGYTNGSTVTNVNNSLKVTKIAGTYDFVRGARNLTSGTNQFVRVKVTAIKAISTSLTLYGTVGGVNDTMLQQSGPLAAGQSFIYNAWVSGALTYIHVNTVTSVGDSGDTFTIDWVYVGTGEYSTIVQDKVGNNHGTLIGGLPDYTSFNGLKFNGSTGRILFTAFSPTRIGIYAEVQLGDLTSYKPVFANKAQCLRIYGSTIQWYSNVNASPNLEYTIPNASTSKMYKIYVWQGADTSAYISVDGVTVNARTDMPVIDNAATATSAIGYYSPTNTHFYGKIGRVSITTSVNDLYYTTAYAAANPGKKYSPFIDGIFMANGPSMWSRHTQSNCFVSLAETSWSANKYCYFIYRPANKTVAIDGNTMYGGVRINIPESAKVEGRKYKLRFRYRGVTSAASANPYFGYLIGDGSYQGTTSHTLDTGLPAIPANTNTNTWKYFEDTYTVTNRMQTGLDLNTYDTYRQFTIRWNYEDTGSLGTRIFIDEIEIQDITNSVGLFIPKKDKISIPQLKQTSAVAIATGTASDQSPYPSASGIPTTTFNGVSLLSGYGRGLTLTIWAETGVVSHCQTYDIWGNPAARTSLANQLASISAGSWWSLVSYDACLTDATLNAQMLAMNMPKFVSWDWSSGAKYKTPYAAIGIGQRCLKEDLRPQDDSRFIAAVEVAY